MVQWVALSSHNDKVLGAHLVADWGAYFLCLHGFSLGASVPCTGQRCRLSELATLNYPLVKM